MQITLGPNQNTKTFRFLYLFVYQQQKEIIYVFRNKYAK